MQEIWCGFFLVVWWVSGLDFCFRFSGNCVGFACQLLSLTEGCGLSGSCLSLLFVCFGIIPPFLVGGGISYM